jgi:hypothetical protein
MRENDKVTVLGCMVDSPPTIWSAACPYLVQSTRGWALFNMLASLMHMSGHF